jgi:hypothetical protein
MLRQKGSLCEIGACTDQVSGVDAYVQRAAAADLAGWSEYQHKRVRQVSFRMAENLCVVYAGYDSKQHSRG